jgi:predicted nucleotidyltransferase
MSVNRKIDDLCRQIVKKFNPKKIILFGSHANGTPTEDSDIDIMVVMPFKGRNVDMAIEIRKNISVNIALDLMVRSPAEIEDRLSKEDFFIRGILEEGKVLYESPA